jgi:hypothetical protein
MCDTIGGNDSPDREQLIVDGHGRIEADLNVRVDQLI